MTARLIAFDYRPDKDLPLHDSIPTVQWKGILGADPKIWIALALVTSAAVNMLRIKVRRYCTFMSLLFLWLTCIQWYGRCEYFFGVFKLISLVILILAQIAINAAGKGMLFEFISMNVH
jgi:hypothetical protein